MINLPLNNESITSRLAEIGNDLVELKKFQGIAQADFESGQNFAIAEHYLRRALEAVFDISNHILTRLPEAMVKKPETYKAMATLMGEYKIVPQEFATGALTEMAGYRNRLVHFYHEVTKAELYEITQHDLPDLEEFCSYIKKILENPKEYGFEISA